MSARPGGRAFDLDPDRWRTPADGPRWLYAAPGRLRVVWRLAVFGLAIALMQPVAESIIAPLMRTVSQAADMRLEAYPWVTLVAIAGGMGVALRLVDHAPWRGVALDGVAWRPGALARGFAVGAAAIIGTAALLWLSGHATIVTTPAGVLPGALPGAVSIDDVRWSTDSWTATSVRLAIFLAPAALWEELLFRGYLWSVATDAAGERVARWSTALAFGVVHLMNPGAGALSTLLVILAGLALGALRERTGSLPAVWMAHFAWNWVMAALLHVPVSGVPFDTPGYRVVMDGPAWWTGGSWGPEGGAAALVVIGGALVISARAAAREHRATRLVTENGLDER